MDSLRIALAQINPSVGDINSNSQKIIREIERAVNLGADLVAFPELSVTGYPPEDLLLRKQFVSENLSAVEKIVEKEVEVKSKKQYNKKSLFTPAQEPVQAGGVTDDGEIDKDS